MTSHELLNWPWFVPFWPFFYYLRASLRQVRAPIILFVPPIGVITPLIRPIQPPIILNLPLIKLIRPQIRLIRPPMRLIRQWIILIRPLIKTVKRVHIGPFGQLHSREVVSAPA